MIALSYRGQIDANLYDECWYVSHTNPGMQLNCKWHREFAASEELGKECYVPGYDTKEWVLKYEDEFRNDSRKMEAARKLVERSNNGEWIQLLFYEKTSEVSEGSALYRILSDLGAECQLTY